ncbi:MAG: glycoside hydrolase family 2 TIM barrel-domain containing protein [Pricia sp.]
MNKFITALVFFILLAQTSLFGQTQKNALRTKTNINENWNYSETPSKDVAQAAEASDWQQIDLPHTWNATDATDTEPGYRRASSWYKKKLDMPEVASDKQYVLYFEGSNITTEVYVNGEKAGEHIGGYVGFDIDITDFIKQGANQILVRVDNGYNRDIIPSQKSDFFIYGGITRDVWLKTEPKQHISKLKITTPSVSAKKASLMVSASLENKGAVSNLKVNAVLFDPSGKKVSTQQGSITDGQLSVDFGNIKNPELWDIDSPNLYSVELSLLEGKKTVDKVSDRLGFRWFEFKDYGAFYLNGKRVLLRGTHRHEEHAGVGAAMSNAQHRKDMEQIKGMGTNFVRLGHYSQDPEVYKACDELGLLVWDELPWCRGGMGGEVWQENTKRLLGEMIDQNYNHPSVIIWSLGNEMYWLPDFEDGDNTEKMNVFLSELNTIAHDMDPVRKTAIRKYYEGSDIVDVFSPSIWSGWYSGSYKSYQKAIDTYKKEYKHFLHAEYGGSSHLGRHSENPITGEGEIQSDGWEEAIVQTEAANIAQIGDWSESYINDLFDWHLRITETDPDFVGNAQWAFKDFGTPLRPENAIPYMNQKGLVDREGNPKDGYYVYKSYWSNDPFTYIESHTWTERQGPENLSRSLNVFSNCPTVTLHHNGEVLEKKSRNIKSFPASGYTWDIQFQEGENELIAIGNTKDGKTVSDTLTVNYRFTKNEVAKSLTLSSKKLDNGNYLVTSTAIDKNGLRCLDYEERVYFQCLEGGETKKHQGTPTGSETIEMANGKASIEVMADETDRPLKVMVLNQSFKGTYLVIEK